MGKLFLGIDLGSSSVKTSLLDGESGEILGRAGFPEQEQPISSPQTGWAEQNPQMWWKNFKAAYGALIKKTGANPKTIASIGISYQMHGLVAVDVAGELVRDSIIWCDSRAVETGEKAYEKLGQEYCQQCLLNAPGNFTASKLAWVKEHEPETYQRIHKIMLPGDWLTMKLSGTISTTKSGLSEGVFWDFEKGQISQKVLEALNLDPKMLPDLVPNIGASITVDEKIAEELGMHEGVTISYRAGDQPNNAFSLNVLKPAEVAATAGTSGVIYAVTDEHFSDRASRVNTFVHVTDTHERIRNGILLCVNGTGILYSWMRKVLSTSSDLVEYPTLNTLAEKASCGADGLRVYPFGNGAERLLGNQHPGASILGLDFNRHGSSELLRASLEGIVFALKMGMDVIHQSIGEPKTIRVGNANLFLSALFAQIFADVMQSALEVYDTDGADGAARGAALGAGFYRNEEEAFHSLKRLKIIEPKVETSRAYQNLYQRWLEGTANLE